MFPGFFPSKTPLSPLFHARFGGLGSKSCLQRVTRDGPGLFLGHLSKAVDSFLRFLVDVYDHELKISLYNGGGREIAEETAFIEFRSRSSCWFDSTGKKSG